MIGTQFENLRKGNGGANWNQLTIILAWMTYQTISSRAHTHTHKQIYKSWFARDFLIFRVTTTITILRSPVNSFCYIHRLSLDNDHSDMPSPVGRTCTYLETKFPCRWTLFIYPFFSTDHEADLHELDQFYSAPNRFCWSCPLLLPANTLVGVYVSVDWGSRCKLSTNTVASACRLLHVKFDLNPKIGNWWITGWCA